jgi:hypothetical protein
MYCQTSDALPADVEAFGCEPKSERRTPEPAAVRGPSPTPLVRSGFRVRSRPCNITVGSTASPTM